MSDLSPEVQVVDLYIGGRFYCRVSREVYEEELRIAREVRPAIDAMRAWADKALLDEAATLILGTSDQGEQSVEPTAIEPESEAQRVQRELVPLMRTAATTAQVAPVPRLNEDLARLKVYTTKQFPEAPWDLTNGDVRVLQALFGSQ